MINTSFSERLFFQRDELDVLYEAFDGVLASFTKTPALQRFKKQMESACAGREATAAEEEERLLFDVYSNAAGMCLLCRKGFMGADEEGEENPGEFALSLGEMFGASWLDNPFFFEVFLWTKGDTRGHFLS
jgi:hypothetical protein